MLFLRLIAAIIVATLLSGCADGALALTYGERMATAEAQGCWAGAERTPLPVTVTPLPVTPQPPTLVNPGDPTATTAPSATALPTTTPLPRCTPQPGTTQAPWPTPWATRPPLPTRVAADRQYPVIANHAVMRLPDHILALDMAVHPTEGWPVVAALEVPLGHAGPARVFVAAYDDVGAAWHPGVLVSLPGSAPGHHFRSVAVGVTGDGTIHAVWGASHYPESAMFASTSPDRGQTWSAPQRLGASPVMRVLDVVTTLDNHVFVLALNASEPPTPVVWQRSPDGAWHGPAPLPIGTAWMGTDGQILVVGDGLPGSERVLVVAISGWGSHGNELYLLRRAVAATTWTAGVRYVGSGLAGSVRGQTFLVTHGGQTRPGITVQVAMLRNVSSTFRARSGCGGTCPWLEVARFHQKGGDATPGAALSMNVPPVVLQPFQYAQDLESHDNPPCVSEEQGDSLRRG